MVAAAASTAAARSADVLFKPIKLGALDLGHRVVMAPLTRNRAIDNLPRPIMEQYYSQRASKGGLIISEATVISETGRGYPHVPGVYSKEQVEAWKPIIKAVHDKGGLFVNQLWHAGRASSSDYQPDGRPPLGPSVIPVTNFEICNPKTYQMEKYPPPREMTQAEINTVVSDFARAAAHSREAGFDAVEIHGASGYIIEQFLKDGSNKRTDKYGGPIENRVRFALEVVDAVIKEVGADRAALRASPFNAYLDTLDSHTYALYTYYVEELNSRNLAYLHMVEPRGDERDTNVTDTLAPFRAVYKGKLISAGGHNRDTAIDAVESGHADLVAFGRRFISTPDLPRRIKENKPLNAYKRDFFYTQGAEGYTDYEALA